MRFINTVLFITLAILLMGISSPVKADTNLLGDIVLPEVNLPDWTVGQSASYDLSVSVKEHSESFQVGVKVRFAIVGKEIIDGKTFHWFEIDIDDLKIPHDEEIFFKDLKVKLLMSFVPVEGLNDNRIDLIRDFAQGKIIQKVIFQLDDKQPQEIDYDAIALLFQVLAGANLETIVDEIPFEEINADIPESVKIDSGKETVKVPAGSFSNSSFCSFAVKEAEVDVLSKLYAHEKVPVTGIVKMLLRVKDGGENVNVNFELVDYQMKGAKSLITQAPIPFNISEILED